ncbi:hypothetical protein Bca4012_078720 [Brassica carinata]|uniref:Uncharacterized protein n=2 Tax=Brassica TaxID=3705 RepID=A0A8X7U2V3_BRACI|nr:hypothetical protein Bca52824_071259 [Brassica carinata]CAF2006217.1 unnamed protein product [Brassica napus]
MIVNCKDYNALMIMRCGDVSGVLPQNQGKVYGSKDIVIMLMKLFFENGEVNLELNLRKYMRRKRIALMAMHWNSLPMHSVFEENTMMLLSAQRKQWRDEGA